MKSFCERKLDKVRRTFRNNWSIYWSHHYRGGLFLILWAESQTDLTNFYHPYWIWNSFQRMKGKTVTSDNYAIIYHQWSCNAKCNYIQIMWSRVHVTLNYLPWWFKSIFLWSFLLCLFLLFPFLFRCYIEKE